jgi:hypothetical protein
MEQVNEYVEAFKSMLAEMWDVLKVFGGVFELVGWLATYLGPFGFSLFLLSLVVVGFIGSLSPLSKFANYVLVVAAMTALSISAGADYASLARYIIVMAVPLIIVHGLKFLFSFVRGRLFQGRRKGQLERLEQLADELNKEIAGLRAAA